MYEIKYRDIDERNIYALVENAADVNEAVNAVINDGRAEGLDTIFAVYLSKYKEVYRLQESGGETKFFKVVTSVEIVNADTGRKKTTKYWLLVEAENLDKATKRTYDILRQGYDMEAFSISVTNIDIII